MWGEGVSHRSLRIGLQREALDSGLSARDIASFFSPSPCYIQNILTAEENILTAVPLHEGRRADFLISVHLLLHAVIY